MTSSRALFIFFIASVLPGCAAERLHQEGMDLIEQGQVAEGLAKLEEAAKREPDNLSYHNDLLKKREKAVQRLISNADSERTAGRLDIALQLYQRVLQIDPNSPRGLAGVQNIEMDRRHAAAVVLAQTLFDKHDLQGAQGLLRTVLLENAAQSDAKVLQRRIDEQLAKDAMAGPTLKPEFRKPVTLQFRDANIRMVIEALSRSNNLNIILDKDVKPDLKTTIFVQDASVEDTIDLILLQNQLEKKILSDNTILIYPSTPAKLKDYQDLMLRTFQLTNTDAKQMQTMIKTLLKTKDLYVDEKNNSLVMRDTPDAIRLAEKLIAAQDLPDPEVMLEVEVLEISRSRLTELGVKLPQNFTMSATGTPATTTVNNLPGGGVVTTTTPAQPLTLETLKNIDGSYFNVSPIVATIDMLDTSGDVNILASPRIRVRNKEKAKIHIGDRVPVITNATTPLGTGTSVVTGSVQYLDVGLRLDVEPDIHLDDDVAIKLNLEVSNIVREIASGPTLAYQIGTRSANTVLRLKDGETQVLAGLISDEDRQSAQKFPGLGELPILGRLFSSHKNDAKKNEILLSITPHLTRANQRADARIVEFWSGTEGTLRSRPITAKSGGGVSENKTGALLPSASARQLAALSAAATTATASAPVAISPVRPAPTATPTATPTAVAPSTAATSSAATTAVPASTAKSAAAAVTKPVAAASPATPATTAAMASPAAAPASVGQSAVTPTAAAAIVAATAAASTAGGKGNAKDPAAQPVVLTWQGPTRAKVGEKFQVVVEAQTQHTLGNLSFTLGYDPKVLQIVHVAEGDLLARNGKKTIFNSKVDPDTGRAFLRVERLGPQGVTGKGSVATVTFVARTATAQSPIVINSPITVASNGQQLPHATSTPLVLTLVP